MPAVLRLPNNTSVPTNGDSGILFNSRKIDPVYVEALNKFMHTNLSVHKNYIKAGIKESLYLQETRDYVRNLQNFEELCKIDSGYSYKDIKDEFSRILSPILELNPDTISFSLTTDNSVFFNINKDGKELHLNYFFDDDDDDDDDEIYEKAVITYYAEDKTISYDGSFEEILVKLNEILEKERVISLLYAGFFKNLLFIRSKFYHL